MKRALLIAAIVALSGCTQSIVMRNPTTGATAKCGPYYPQNSPAAAYRETRCIEDFQRQGYVRTSD
jgi:hypothetical protein